jgi:sigma-B regulation protein RsbU (phosphoserine phosphatase)
MALRARMGIAGRLIITSTLLLVLVVSAFGWVAAGQSRRLIDHAARRQQARLVEWLDRAGRAQVLFLAETARIAIVQSDYTTLQETIENVARRDDLMLLVTVVDSSGTVLADSQASQVGRRADATVEPLVQGRELRVVPAVRVRGQQAMIFTAPIVHAGSVLGHVAFASSRAPLQAEMERAQQLKQIELKATLAKTLGMGLLSVLVGAVLTILQGVRISRPIREVARKADQIARGDLQARALVNSQDEIGLMADRFNFMAEQVSVLMNEALHKAAMEKELELASAVQATLVPSSPMIKRQGISLAGYFKPATRCAGDWWTYYDLSHGRLMVIIGDVTGHGAASAMVTAVAKGTASTVNRQSGGNPDLAELMLAMNAAIHDISRGQFVMTCFVTIFDPRTYTLEFANAGHHFPMLYRAGTGEIEGLVSRGSRLGDLAEAHFALERVQVAPEDVLVWYTDGVIECQNAAGTVYGERRFRAVIREHAAQPAERVRDATVQESSRFCGTAAAQDDVTVVVGKFS